MFRLWGGSDCQLRMASVKGIRDLLSRFRRSIMFSPKVLKAVPRADRTLMTLLLTLVVGA